MEYKGDGTDDIRNDTVEGEDTPETMPTTGNWLTDMGSHVFDLFGGAATKKTPLDSGRMAIPASKAANPEYEAEKAAEELKNKKKLGVAPWKFGEGSAELQSQKPWYNYDAETAVGVRPTVGPFGKPIDAAKRDERDGRAKAAADPLTTLERQLHGDSAPPVAAVVPPVPLVVSKPALPSSHSTKANKKHRRPDSSCDDSDASSSSSSGRTFRICDFRVAHTQWWHQLLR